jgi:DNA-binding HxlR family transcriptional regulator
MGASVGQRLELDPNVTERLSRARDHAEGRYLSFPFRDCPVKATVGVLGKKWTLRILGQIGVYGRDRFNRLLTALPGIAPKVLASQLTDLEEAGLLARVTLGTSPKRVRWALTERGRDAMIIVIVMTGFASKHYPELLFDDGKPRRLNELLDEEGTSLVRGLLKN